MPRFILLAACLMVPLASQLEASPTAFFDQLEHDFGTVQRGALLNHDFILTNHSKHEVRIKRLRVSCSCTRANAASMTIPPGQATAISAIMDTSSFEGSKSVTIHVDFERPRREEVSLRLSCVSLTTPAASASEIDFGVVSAGSPIVKRMNLDYVGNPDWQVLGMDYGNPHLKAEIQEISRDAAKVRYELKLTLAGTAPAGSLEDKIRIKTNDPRSSEMIVIARANVQAQLVVSPDSLVFENLVPGQKITKNLIVKGPAPFRVTRADKTLGMFEIRSSPEAKTAQLVVLTLTVPDDLKLLTDHIELVTDLPGEQIVSVLVKN